MFSKRRFAYFGFGFCLGCCILYGIQFAKKKAQGAVTQDACRPVSVRELCCNQKPMDPYLALFYTEEPLDAHTLQRTLVYDRVGPSGYVRVEERITNMQPKALLERRLFQANRLRVQPDLAANADGVIAVIQSLGLSYTLIEDSGALDITLPSHGIPSLQHWTDVLHGHGIHNITRIELPLI